MEIRGNDKEALRAVLPINDPQHEATTSAERAFLAAIEAGCSSPAAAWCRFESDETIRLDVAVLDHCGKQKVASSLTDHPSNATALGERAAEWALANGAAELLLNSG